MNTVDMIIAITDDLILRDKIKDADPFLSVSEGVSEEDMRTLAMAVSWLRIGADTIEAVAHEENQSAAFIAQRMRETSDRLKSIEEKMLKEGAK